MQTRQINGRIYEIVSFSSKLTNQSIATNGIGLANGYLAVSGSPNAYRLYNTRSGEPILRCRFKDLNDALKFAEWIEKVYADYFEIWQDYPKANIVSMCKYTVDDGALIFETIEMLNTLEIVTLKDVSAMVEKARKEKSRWQI